MAKGKISKKDREETEGLRNGATTIKSFDTERSQNSKKRVENMTPLERINHELQAVADQYDQYSQFIVPEGLLAILPLRGILLGVVAHKLHRRAACLPC